jgi:hypothetical protein
MKLNLSKAWTLAPVNMNFGMFIKAQEAVSAVYSISPVDQ